MSLELVNVALALYLVGVIWVVQVVHYPLFARVGREDWSAYERAHRIRITPVVAAPMLAQPAVAALVLLDGGGALGVVNLVLCSAILLVTVTLFGGLHERLERGWDDAVHARLLRYNLVRAVAWTAQGGVALALAAGG